MFKKRKRLKIALLSFFVITLTACLVANWYVKKKGYRNLWHYITEAGGNYQRSKSAKYETLEIKMVDSDFKKLENIREKAIERGILISEDGNWVEASLKWKSKKIKAKLRLKGHMMDHLGENKWSFRIKTKGKDAFMGMKVFSLQEPGTRNYVYEWIYHQMMKQEGIIALQYDFIKLKVNGKDWGIYAVEEHFGQELIQRNQRVKGPIVRFDPEMYWKYRINELNKISIRETSADFRSAFVDVYENSDVLEDSALLNRYARCATLIQALREGKASTSEIFDIDKLARFHAIIDLVGGHHSLDWSDVKYYYNAESDLLEPVAYESFSINPTVQLAGAFKFNQRERNPENWSSLLFSDEAFFSKYIHYLKTYSKKKWLKTFFDRHRKEMDNKLAILYKEYYSKQLPMEQYYSNQKNIEALLESPKGFVSYFNSIDHDSIFFDLSGMDALPYQVSGIKMNDSVFPVRPIIVNPRSLNGQLCFSRVGFVLPELVSKKMGPQTKMYLVASILGNDKKIDHQVIMTPSPDVSQYVPQVNTVRLNEIPFIKINDTDSTILFEKGKHTIALTMNIPKGYTVKVPAGTSLSFTHQARLISYSPLLMKGTEEEPIMIQSGDSVSGSIVLLNTGKKISELDYVMFLNKGQAADKDLSAALRIYQSTFRINDCYFGKNGNDALRISSSNGEINRSVFTGSARHAIHLQYSSVQLKEVNVKASKNGIYLRGSRCLVDKISFAKSACGFKVTEMSYLQGADVNLKKNTIGIDCSEKSTANIRRLTATENDLVFKVHKSGDVYGPAVVNVQGLKTEKNKKLSEVGKKSTLNLVE